VVCLGVLESTNHDLDKVVLWGFVLSGRSSSSEHRIGRWFFSETQKARRRMRLPADDFGVKEREWRDIRFLGLVFDRIADTAFMQKERDTSSVNSF
jgi:hypothetical protein